MLACEWSGYDDLNDQISRGLTVFQRVAEPFGFQAISSSESELLKCAQIFYEHKFKKMEQPIFRQSLPISPSSKLKIGYLCGEFREQATSVLMVGLWEAHDKEQFEIYAFDNGLSDGSMLRSRIESCFNEIIDIKHHSDAYVAQLIFDRKIDILINLNGFFGWGRNGVFALKPAPIQVNFLGFPGTLGSDCFDYIFADQLVIPTSSLSFYSEKVVYLPDCYQPNDHTRLISNRIFTRPELGLPSEGFIFCCFNNNYKITPLVFESWMKILKRVQGSVLWLLEDNDSVSRNLWTTAESLGVEAKRIIFAKRMSMPEHLSRQRCADLFLDTSPYNAHTTASDALWAGLPLLTTRGCTFPGRVASSLLKCLGLDELIVDSIQEYEDKAVALASNTNLCIELKNKLNINILNKPLFNIDKYTIGFENGLRNIFDRYVSGVSPDHIFSAKK
jgi:predicted O-linked N-acetylglucosamine transferase (SPINDLY family)